MQNIFRSTTALVAILGIAAPTIIQAQGAPVAPPTIRLAQGDAPVVVVPPGQAVKKKRDQAAEEAKEEEPAAEEAAKAEEEEPAREENAKAEESEPAVVAPEPDVEAEANAEAEVEAEPQRERAAEEPAEPEEAAPRRAQATEEPAEPDEAAPRRAQATEEPAEPAQAEAQAETEAESSEPVVIPPKLDSPRREPARAESTDEPAVVAPGNDEPAPRAAERAPQSDEPAVVAPSNDEPAPRAAESAPQNDEPAVAAPEDQGNAVRAATGQSEAPRVVTPDAAGLAEALEAAQSDKATTEEPRREAESSNNDGNDPVVVVPEGEGAAAAAAAKGGPVKAEALDAAVDDVSNAKAVVVTEESARSSSEDFATSVAGAAAAAAEGKDGPVVTDAEVNRDRNGNDPAVVVPGETTEARNRDNDGDDDDDDTLGTLAGIAAAGLAVYAAGQILDNNQGQVALNTGDRVVVQAPDGTQQIWRDDDALLLRPGAEVATENFADGSSRSVVTRPDGSRVVTIRDAQLRVLRRTLIAPDGTPTELINDAAEIQPVDVSRLPPPARVLPVGSGTEVSTTDLRAALEQEAGVDRRFSLGQIRNISQVRNLVAPISIDSITFDTGSAAIPPNQAQQLSTLGSTIADMVRANPREVFLIEGYTDTVGQPASNLALSDRRAESLALALTEYFGVPPENMVVQGYGETFLRVNAEGDVRENRRVAVRRITDLLQQ